MNVFLFLLNVKRMLENKHNRIQLAPQKLLKRSIWAHKIDKKSMAITLRKKKKSQQILIL